MSDHNISRAAATATVGGGLRQPKGSAFMPQPKASLGVAAVKADGSHTVGVETP